MMSPQKGFNSFFPRTIRDWDSLDIGIVSVKTYSRTSGWDLQMPETSWTQAV